MNINFIYLINSIKMYSLNRVPLAPYKLINVKQMGGFDYQHRACMLID